MIALLKKIILGLSIVCVTNTTSDASSRKDKYPYPVYNHQVKVRHWHVPRLVPPILGLPKVVFLTPWHEAELLGYDRQNFKEVLIQRYGNRQKPISLEIKNQRSFFDLK